MGAFRRRKKGPSAATPEASSGVATVVAKNSIALSKAEGAGVGAASKAAKKKAAGARLWLRFDRTGQSELMEVDKSLIITLVAVPPRDLRILGPIFSHSSRILAREKAMLVNMEFIRAIVTAEEVLLLDPLCQEVLPFVEQLKQLVPHKSPSGFHGAGQTASAMQLPTSGQWLPLSGAAEGLPAELPFEFQVLEIALEVVCMCLDSSVVELEHEAYPMLDELAISVSTNNLEHVRSLKSNLTRLLARVQKVRDEIEHLLDDNEDMAQLYLTRKWIQNQQYEASLGGTASSNIIPAVPLLRHLSSARSGSLVRNYSNDHDVEDLEMLLEAYFVLLDRTCNRLLSVREYIDDTEDYVNIQLDNQRNELRQLRLTLTIASFSIAVETLIVATFGMNIPCPLFNVEGIFEVSVGCITAACTLLFCLVLGYARWKRLLGSS